MKLKPETIQQHRARQAQYLRQVHKMVLTEGQESGACDCSACEARLIADRKHSFSTYALIGSIVLATLILWTCVAHSSVIEIGYSDTAIVNAIYTIEGGTHTRWPYGILAHYRHTTPRQACFNTVAHQRRNWLKESQPGPFLGYLARHYAPIGAGNDPQGLNANWLPNLKAVLAKNTGH